MLSIEEFIDEFGDLGVGNVRVDARLVLSGTALSEGNDTGELVVDDQWTTAVSLAAVFSVDSGAEHSTR